MPTWLFHTLLFLLPSYAILTIPCPVSLNSVASRKPNPEQSIQTASLLPTPLLIPFYPGKCGHSYFREKLVL